MIATGESGHIFSRHYGDLTPLWNDVKSITLAGSEDELKKAGRPRADAGALMRGWRPKSEDKSRRRPIYV